MMPERIRVEDITKLETGQSIKHIRDDGRTQWMTVKEPYGVHQIGQFAAQEGVLCMVHRRVMLPAYDMLLTKTQVAEWELYLAEPHEIHVRAVVDSARDEMLRTPGKLEELIWDFLTSDDEDD